MAHDVTFPHIELLDSTKNCVIFPARLEHERITCVVGNDVLSNRFGEPLDNPISAFQNHREQIEAIARALIQANRVDDGELLITSDDVPESHD